MEVYQWLFRQNGYKVSDTGYFVYCNGNTDRQAFDAKLEFDITLIINNQINIQLVNFGGGIDDTGIDDEEDDITWVYS